MEGMHLDAIARSIANRNGRRFFCQTLAVGVFGAALTRLGLSGVAAGCTKLRKKCSKSDQCCGDLDCGRPTTRHTCDSQTGHIRKWCCVKPGGRCKECDCCGDYYCAGNGRCKRNPEG
jgi:hypothetical protein